MSLSPALGGRSRRPAPVVSMLLIAAMLAPLGALVWAAPGADEPWRIETTVDGSEPKGRHEAGGVDVDGRMYLLGGRAGNAGQRVDAYDPVANTWTALGPMPVELHHFQPVVIGTEIWIVGALTGDYPREPSMADIHVYDTASRAWRIAGQVPEGRRRGSAAAALHEDGLVYVLGGNTLGHDGGAVAWFDRFDPATGVWETLPDAPHARDHFGIAILDGKVVAAGGRASTPPDRFANTVSSTDVYSLDAGTWTSEADIPTKRAGAFTVGHDGELIVVGGEVSGRGEAYAVAEAYDASGGTWRTLQPLNVGRHSGGAAVLGDRLHLVAGSGRLGGGNLQVHESLGLDHDPGAVDGDGDGLTDAEEAELGTDPQVADTDGDTLDDGTETVNGTDPLLTDTDGDGLDDAVETAGPTDPLVRDTDGDGLGDGIETGLGTDPTVADTDRGGVDDGDEVDAGTDPLDGDDDGNTDDGNTDGGNTDGGGDDTSGTDGGDTGGGNDAGGSGGAGTDTGETGTGTAGDGSTDGAVDGSGSAGTTGGGPDPEDGNGDGGTDEAGDTSGDATTGTEEPVRRSGGGGATDGLSLLLGSVLLVAGLRRRRRTRRR